MQRKFVYKVISALLLIAMLASFSPGALVRAGDPPPGIELNGSQKREIARQVKEAGADEVFFPEARGGELVVGMKKDGETQYLVAWKGMVSQDRLKEDLPEAGSPSQVPKHPPQQGKQPFVNEEAFSTGQPRVCSIIGVAAHVLRQREQAPHHPL